MQEMQGQSSSIICTGHLGATCLLIFMLTNKTCIHANAHAFACMPFKVGLVVKVRKVETGAVLLSAKAPRCKEMNA